MTIELTGRMLPGTEIGAALTVLDSMQVDVAGLNCATGPVEMSEALRHLSAASRVPIACVPNAGLPSVVDGNMHYDLTPEDLAEHLHRFVTEFGVSAIGGCCGTTPAHLAAVVERCAGATPAARAPVHEPAAASIYTSVPFRQDTSFLVVGERTNANGSKAFREAMLEGDWDTCVGHGPRPGQGGLPPHRRLRRLHGCRRCGGHDRGGAAASARSRACRLWSTPPRAPSCAPPWSGSAAGPS